MTSWLDGLQNITSINANIEALKKAKENSATALSSGQNTQSQSDIDNFLVKNETSFNSMLNILVGSEDDDKTESSSDYFSFLQNDQSSALSSLQSTADLQKLAAMQNYSSLIGKTAVYFDSATGEQKSGVISEIKFTTNAAPIVVLKDGTELPAGAVSSLR